MEVVRIAMWSGPRNISTAMMRSFGVRSDTVVVDEPFYAAYLAQTGLNHPMRDAVLASQPNDWRQVIERLFAPLPAGKRMHYQKHMTHHMLPSIARDWMARCRNAFLIRDPTAVLASYAQKRGDVTLADIGVVQQHELFQREADRLGKAPPVVESSDVLADPAAMLAKLCAALDIDYQAAMLHWPAGRRDTDGVWAPAWYHAVEQSTGFAKSEASPRIELPEDLQRIAAEARPYYAAMWQHRLG